MQTITLAAVPNQSFSVRLDNRQYDFKINFASNIMAVSIARDNQQIISGVRAVSGTPLLPYLYQESGNFLILTNDDDYPIYTEFGITQSLIYASAEELEAIRAGS